MKKMKKSISRYILKVFFEMLHNTEETSSLGYLCMGYSSSSKDKYSAYVRSSASLGVPI